MKKTEIAILLNDLTIEELHLFVISCLMRIIDLFKQFDEEEDISLAYPKVSKGEGYKRLSYILEEIKKDINSGQNYINELDEIFIDMEIYGNSTIVFIADYIIKSMQDLLAFCVYKRSNYVYICSTNITEILNQAKSKEYIIKLGKSRNAEIDQYLQEVFLNEINIEKSIIEKIKNKENISSLYNYIKEYKITFKSK